MLYNTESKPKPPVTMVLETEIERSPKNEGQNFKRIALLTFGFAHSRKKAERELTHTGDFLRELTHVGAFFSVS